MTVNDVSTDVIDLTPGLPSTPAGTAYALEPQRGIFAPDFAKEFVAFLDVSPRSVRTYTRAVQAFFSFAFREGLTTATREDVIRFRDVLTAEGKKPTTVQTYLQGVKLFFRFLEVKGYAQDVAEHIKGPRLSKGHKKDYLTPQQVQSVLQGIDRKTPEGRRDFAMLLLMTVCGLRTIEVSNANIEDIRPLGAKTVLYLLGKGRTEKKDFVRLTPTVESAIREMLKDRKGAAADAPLFASLSRNNRGGRMTTRAISGIAKEAFRAAGIDSERITAHSLRHTAVTLALLAGVSLQEVQAFARHASISTTQIYAHNLDAMKNHSESAIEAALLAA